MENKISFKNELIRKGTHLLILILPILFYSLGRVKSLSLIAAPALIFIAIDFFRHKNNFLRAFFEKLFKPILRDHELNQEKFCGASWLFLAVIPIFALCKTEIVITSLVILAICDTLAAIFGRLIPSKAFFEKSRVGSIAFYISGVFVLFICGSIMKSNFLFYPFGFFSLFCATIIEARPSLFSVDDNFSVPISFATLMTIFDFMWNYTV